MPIDPQRMSALWHLLEAAEDRFCGPDLSHQDALRSFSAGLRDVMRRAREGVDLAGAKSYFSVLLQQKNYSVQTAASAPVLRDDPRRIPDALILALGRAFPPAPPRPRGPKRRDHATQFPPEMDSPRTRSLMDDLISETRLYDSSKAVKDLFNFTARLRHIAPFNAMLLHTQKNGLGYVATARDWKKRFRRYPKSRARPLVIMRNFGPVDFVFEVSDTEGHPLPVDAFSFPAIADIPRSWFGIAESRLAKAGIQLILVDEGDRRAGRVWLKKDYADKTRFNDVALEVNANHASATQFVTLVHELAHLYLGHLGADIKRGVEQRTGASLALREVEAESVAYIVAKRSGVSPRSESYLSRYKGAFEQLDLQVILQAAQAIERLLHLPARPWPTGADDGQSSFDLDP